MYLPEVGTIEFMVQYKGPRASAITNAQRNWDDAASHEKEEELTKADLHALGLWIGYQYPYTWRIATKSGGVACKFSEVPWETMFRLKDRLQAVSRLRPADLKTRGIVYISCRFDDRTRASVEGRKICKFVEQNGWPETMVEYLKTPWNTTKALMAPVAAHQPQAVTDPSAAPVRHSQTASTSISTSAPSAPTMPTTSSAMPISPVLMPEDELCAYLTRKSQTAQTPAPSTSCMSSTSPTLPTSVAAVSRPPLVASRSEPSSNRLLMQKAPTPSPQVFGTFSNPGAASTNTTSDTHTHTLSANPANPAATPQAASLQNQSTSGLPMPISSSPYLTPPRTPPVPQAQEKATDPRRRPSIANAQNTSVAVPVDAASESQSKIPGPSASPSNQQQQLPTPCPAASSGSSPSSLSTPLLVSALQNQVATPCASPVLQTQIPPTTSSTASGRSKTSEMTDLGAASASWPKTETPAVQLQQRPTFYPATAKTKVTPAPPSTFSGLSGSQSKPATPIGSPIVQSQNAPVPKSSPVTPSSFHAPFPTPSSASAAQLKVVIPSASSAAPIQQQPTPLTPVSNGSAVVTVSAPSAVASQPTATPIKIESKQVPLPSPGPSSGSAATATPITAAIVSNTPPPTLTSAAPLEKPSTSFAARSNDEDIIMSDADAPASEELKTEIPSPAAGSATSTPVAAVPAIAQIQSPISSLSPFAAQQLFATPFSHAFSPMSQSLAKAPGSICGTDSFLTTPAGTTLIWGASKSLATPIPTSAFATSFSSPAVSSTPTPKPATPSAGGYVAFNIPVTSATTSVRGSLFKPAATISNEPTPAALQTSKATTSTSGANKTHSFKDVPPRSRSPSETSRTPCSAYESIQATTTVEETSSPDPKRKRPVADDEQDVECLPEKRARVETTSSRSPSTSGITPRIGWPFARAVSRNAFRTPSEGAEKVSLRKGKERADAAALTQSGQSSDEAAVLRAENKRLLRESQELEQTLNDSSKSLKASTETIRAMQSRSSRHDEEIRRLSSTVAEQRQKIEELERALADEQQRAQGAFRLQQAFEATVHAADLTGRALAEEQGKRERAVQAYLQEQRAHQETQLALVQARAEVREAVVQALSDAARAAREAAGQSLEEGRTEREQLEEALRQERARREDAESALEDQRREAERARETFAEFAKESQEPLVVPAIYDAFAKLVSLSDMRAGVRAPGTDAS